MVDTNTDLDTAPKTPYTDDDEAEIVIDDEETPEDVDDEDGEPDQWKEADPKGEAKPEDGDELVQISKKELSTMKQSYTESTQEAQKLHRVDKVRVDPYEFIKLYESDQAIAAKVLKHVWEEKDPRDLYNELRKAKFGEDDPKVQREELVRAAEEKFVKKEFGRLVKAAGIDLDTKSWKAFQEEYDFLTENGKRVSSDNVDTFVAKAMKLAGVKNISQVKAKTDKELIWAGSAGKSTIPGAANDKGSFFDSFDRKGPKDWYNK